MGVCSFACWAWVCILYFTFALIFLTVLGILCKQDSFLSAVDDKQLRKNAALPVFLAVAIYAVFALMSSIYLFYHAKKVGKAKAAEHGQNPYASRQRRGSGTHPGGAGEGLHRRSDDPIVEDADTAHQESIVEN